MHISHSLCAVTAVGGDLLYGPFTWLVFQACCDGLNGATSDAVDDVVFRNIVIPCMQHTFNRHRISWKERCVNPAS